MGAARTGPDRAQVGQTRSVPGGPDLTDRIERVLLVERAEIRDQERKPGPLLDVARGRDLGVQTGRALPQGVKPPRRKSNLLSQPRGLGARAQARCEWRAVAVIDPSFKPAHVDAGGTPCLTAAAAVSGAAARACVGTRRARPPAAASLAEFGARRAG